MQSKLTAMTWEYWRKNRWWTLGLMLALASIGAILIGLSGFNRNEDQQQLYAGILVAIEFMGIAYFMLWAQYDSNTQRLGFDLHHYTQPIRTSTLVTWQVVLRLINVAVLHSWVLLILKVTQTNELIADLFTLEVFLLAVWLNAVIWMFPHCGWLQRILGLMTVLLTPWISFVINFVGGILWALRWNIKVNLLEEFINLDFHDFPEFCGNPITVSVKISLLIIGLIFACWAVAWDRRGSSPSLKQIQAWKLNHLLNATPYRSALSAVFWIEFKRRAWMGAMINIINMAFLWIVLLSGLSPVIVTSFLIILGSLNLVVFPIILGIQLGQHGGNSFLIESYKSTKPLSTGSLLTSYLLASLASLAVMWGIYIIGALGLGILLYLDISFKFEELGFFAELLTEIYDDPMNLVLMGLFGWTAMGIAASVMMAGRKWLAITFWVGIWMVPLALSLIGHLVIREFCPEHWFDYFGKSLLVLIVILILGGTTLAYASAWRKQLLHKYVGILVAIIVSCVLVYAWHKGGVIPWLTLWALPLAPIATAPLALAWNRHR